MRRSIGARIPDLSGVAPLLASSDMLGTFPPLTMVGAMQLYGLRALKPPVPLAPFASRFFWSSRLANDPAHRWIRGVLFEVYSKLQQSAEASLACELDGAAVDRVSRRNSTVVPAAVTASGFGTERIRRQKGRG
jgi:hypothetical protein